MSDTENGTRELVRTENEFGSPAPTASNAVAKTDQTRAVAEVHAAMMIARMNPRDPVAAMDKILNACQRKTLATAAVYTYARGGSNISGPSIRLAEVCAQNWGNIQYGIRELELRNGESTVQAFAWDVETNTRREVTFQVPHVRHTKQGRYNLTDPRDIYEMVANQGARRLRSCILGVIPGDVVEMAVTQCEETMKAKADTSPENVQKIVEAFSEFGVTKEQIEKRIQRRIDAVQPAQVVSLQKIYLSLRDGMSGPEDWFELVESGEEVSKTRTEKLKDLMPKTQPAPATAPEPAPAAAPVAKEEAPATDGKLPLDVEKPKPFNRAEAVTELMQIATEIYGPDKKRTNEAVQDWTRSQCTTLTELTKAPDAIIEAALPEARATRDSFR